MKSISDSAGAQAKSKTPVASICSLLAVGFYRRGMVERGGFVCAGTTMRARPSVRCLIESRVLSESAVPHVLVSRALIAHDIRVCFCSLEPNRVPTITTTVTPRRLDWRAKLIFCPRSIFGTRRLSRGSRRAFDTPVTRRLCLLFANFCPTRGFTQLLFLLSSWKRLFDTERSFYGARCVPRWIHPARMQSFEIANPGEKKNYISM